MVEHTASDTLEAATFRVTIDGALYAAGSFVSARDRDLALFAALKRARQAARAACDRDCSSAETSAA